jgi:hypothetical protein
MILQFQTRSQPSCEAPGDGEATREDQARRTSTEYRNLREAISSEGLLWPAAGRVHIFSYETQVPSYHLTLNFNLILFSLFRPAFAPLYSNQYHHQHSSNIGSAQHNQWNSSQNYSNLHHHLQNNKRDFDGLSTSSSRKEKRQYKKRKHKAPREIKPGKGSRMVSRMQVLTPGIPVEAYDGLFSSDDEDVHSNQMVASESEDEGIYPFRRNRNCDYYKVSRIFGRDFH